MLFKLMLSALLIEICCLNEKSVLEYVTIFFLVPKRWGEGAIIIGGAIFGGNMVHENDNFSIIKMLTRN